MTSSATAVGSTTLGVSFHEMRYLLTSQCLIEAREFLVPLAPLDQTAQFCGVLLRPLAVAADSPLATGEPRRLGRLTPNDHSITRGI